MSRNKESKRKAAVRKQAIADIQTNIRRLAVLRDFLKECSESEGDGITGDCTNDAMFAHATVLLLGAELEQALFNLGLTEGFASWAPDRREGWLKEYLK